MKIKVINGPNLNMLGIREPDVYGKSTYSDLVKLIENAAQKLSVETEVYQSNHEGDIIDILHQVGFDESLEGIILNAGAYTHTSLAIADAIAAIKVPVIEVHISNVHSREEVRHHSMISGVCRGVIAGFGMDSYRLGIEAILAQ